MNINEQFGNKLIVKDNVKINIDNKEYSYFPYSAGISDGNPEKDG
jgi:hypothetical protein